MKFIDLLRNRDRSIKNQILRDAPLEKRDSERTRLEKAFSAGSRRWAEEHLPHLLGKEEAEKILKQMERE